MWALIGGAAFVIMLYLNSSPAVQTGYVPPYIPYGAITGNPCPPGWTSAWGGQPCACPPGAIC